MATHITKEERRSIERYRRDGKGIREIARRLGRSPGTISAEININGTKGTYRADRAHEKARLRRKNAKVQCLKVAMDPKLKAYVTAAIEDNQSPESASGRIRYHEPAIRNVSTKAVYKFIHSPHGRNLERHLYQKRVKRRGGRKRGTRAPSDTTKVSIETRSKEANERLEFGHLEGDLIESGKDGTGSLLVLVERLRRGTRSSCTPTGKTRRISTGSLPISFWTYRP
jgi:IS30 family transposase